MKVGRPEHFFNREWSWLDFNTRVLEEAEDPHNPLLERARFLAIVSSNLDEFFMVRVAGVRHQIEAGVGGSGDHGLTPPQVMRGIAERAHALTRRQYQAWARHLRPALAAAGIRVAQPAQLGEADQRFLRRHLEELVIPVLTPIAVGPGHPFPTLLSGHLYLAARPGPGLDLGRLAAAAPPPGSRRAVKPLVFVEVPKVLPRFVPLARRDGTVDLVPLEALLLAHLGAILPGYDVTAAYPIRVTRDADLDVLGTFGGDDAAPGGPDPSQLVDEEAAEDLLAQIQRELLQRRRGAAVRLEYDARLPAELRRRLERELDLGTADLYPHAELLQLADLMPLAEGLERPDLTYRPMTPLPLGPDAGRGDIFARVQRRSRLLFHPYSAFDPVVRLVEAAATDPKVLAIKQTLYRTGVNSPIVAALMRAAENGKQVTALVELRARFDEERNIDWARRLEEAGAHVIYGLAGLKTHCKALLVVRREGGAIRRYLHLGTGNYNARTSRVYSDLGVMTCDEALGRDVGALFNVITGYTEPPAWEKIEIAPTGLRERFLTLIAREAEQSSQRAPGRIVAKVNSLVDRGIIEALYRAARVGVRIDLVVRGICCLRPGVAGLSETIRVRSLVGRFLEHARIFYFENRGRRELYLSSADWMPRNLDRRVELLFPVEDPDHVQTIMGILELQLTDNTKARELGPDGTWTRVPRTGRRVSAQDETYDLLRRDGRPPRRRSSIFVPLGRRRAARAGARRGAGRSAKKEV
jgi:polyphosphate kinase